jgi:hypothetical protein
MKILPVEKRNGGGSREASQEPVTNCDRFLTP